MTMKRASFCCLLPRDLGLATEATKMEEVLSMLLGVIEKVLSGVLIRHPSVICRMLWLSDFAPLIWPQAFGIPQRSENL